MAKQNGSGKRSIIRINKSTVEAQPRPPAGGRSVLWDSEVKGFGVRVTSAGVRTYVVRYQLGGRGAPQRQVTIGRHGSPWTAEQARRRALELLAMVVTGTDPAAERVRAADERAKASERREGRMFDVLADRWFARHVKASGLRSAKEIEGVIERDLKPAFAGMSIDDIDKAAVATALEKIGDRSQAAANKSHKWLRQMFNWFIEKGVVEHSPLDRVKRPFPENRRTRTLGLLELVVVWIACDALPAPFGALYRLLILIGGRLREVSNLPWAELDLEAAEWILPDERSKNKLPHAAPLPEGALAILEERRGGRQVPKGPVLTTDGRTHISGFSKMKDSLDEEIVAVLAANPAAAAHLGEALADWVVHDLRRSLGTGCQAMRIPMEVTEALLNHISGRQDGVRGIYQLYDYFDEKAEALTRWGTLIANAVAAWRIRDVAAILAMDPMRSRRRSRARNRQGPVEPNGPAGVD